MAMSLSKRESKVTNKTMFNTVTYDNLPNIDRRNIF